MLGFSSLLGQPVSARPVQPPVQSRQPLRVLGFKAAGPVKKFPEQKPVLTSLDIDSTLVPWFKEPKYDEVAFTRYKKALGQLDFKKDNLVILNTGRSLSAIKRLAPILKHVPIDALGLNDGQQLYIRPKQARRLQHSNSDNQKWLEGLSRADQDQHWKEALGGWSSTEVLQDIRDTLKDDLGFKLAAKPGEKNKFNPDGQYFALKKPISPSEPEKGDWVIRVCPDQTYFEVDSTKQEATAQEIVGYSELLMDLLGTQLKTKWPMITFYNSSSSEGCHIHMGPAETNKASLIRHVVSTRFNQKPQAVISAGDNTNDIALLTSHELAGVPNYPIFVGDHPKVTAALAKNPPPHLERVDWNKLDEGLEKQTGKVKDLLKKPQDDGNRLDVVG